MDFESADVQLSDIIKLPAEDRKYFFRWASHYLRKKNKRIAVACRMAESGISNEIDNYERSE